MSAQSEQKLMWISTSVTGKLKPAVLRMCLLSSMSTEESTIHCTSRRAHWRCGRRDARTHNQSRAAVANRARVGA
eukprot:scaffold104897_cov72-Phaeocystis_antarctica.AAC.4